MGYKEIAVQQPVHVADQLSKCYERIFGYVLSVGVSDKMARHGNAGQPVGWRFRTSIEGATASIRSRNLRKE